MREVIIISGPTAAGKSAKALSFARELNAEIISCDSIQVYKHMDIGSAKASAQELADVPHHLINVCEPSVQYSVDAYIKDAKKALAEISKRGKNVIVVGGSGFYLKAWFSAVTDEIFIPQTLKSEIEKLSEAEALEKLLQKDSRAAEFIDIQNPRRIRPALERVTASGLSLKELAEKFATLPCPLGDFPKKLELVDLPDEELFAKAKLRAEKMIADGLIDETEKLLEIGIEKNPSAAMAIGYRETIAAIKTNDFSNLGNDIYKNTVSLIKKQRKFFRNTLFKR